MALKNKKIKAATDTVVPALQFITQPFKFNHQIFFSGCEPNA
jgi:hypothetical protein